MLKKKLNQELFEFYLETSQPFKLILSLTHTPMHTYTQTSNFIPAVE